jgi:hypothetical protein
VSWARCGRCGFYHGALAPCTVLQWRAHWVFLLSLPSTEADYWETGSLLRYARLRGRSMR